MSSAEKGGLYKTVIVIWSDEDPTNKYELDELAQEAVDGSMYCSRMKATHVSDPAKDPDWDKTDFFGAVIVTPVMLKAAREALGNNEVDVERVADVLEGQFLTTARDASNAKKQLLDKERQFHAMGGRGADLADEIDDLRIALAVYGKVKAKG